MAITWTKRGTKSGRADSTNNETAPTSGSIGVDLDGVSSISAIFHAPPGQTFDGTGSFLGYRFFSKAWVRAPRSDIDMADFAGLADASIPALMVESPIGRFLYVPSSVGLSGGATVSVDYVCTTRYGTHARDWDE